MKNRGRWIALAAALGLTVICAGTALGASGDKDDPLVTLSYLEQTALPDVVSQVEEKLDERQKELSDTLGQQIDQYKQEVAALGTQGSGASYTLVTLSKGQTMALEVGCEVMLRVGTATVQAATSPALVDVSTGGTVDSGTSLTKNHLYMATIEDRIITPTADTVKLMVRGGYTIA